MIRPDVREKQLAIMASDEWKQKHATACADPAYRKILSETATAACDNRQCKAQRSTTAQTQLKRQWADPGFRAKRIAAMQTSRERRRNAV